MELALRVQGLDYQADQFKALTHKTEIIHTQLDTISAAQDAHTAQISQHISDLSVQVTAADNISSGYLRELSTAQISNQQISQIGFDTLSGQSEVLLRQLAAMLQMLDDMVRSNEQMNHSNKINLCSCCS